MAKKINHAVLKALREEKGWSQEFLARKCAVTKDTISRQERGATGGIRGTLLDSLSKALGVDADILTGRKPRIPQASSETMQVGTHQLNVRVSAHNRNAMALVALRYGVQLSDIVEIAPFLFYLAAERSLGQRQQNISDVLEAQDRLEAMAARLPHLPAGSFFADGDVFRYEQKSIERRDLFGRIVDEAPIHAGGLDYEEGDDNPFARFLMQEAREAQCGASFESWSCYGYPYYKICKDEAVAIVGGDHDAAEYVLNGTAPLHKMPEPVRAGSAADRATWATQCQEEEMARWEAAVPGLADLLSKSGEPA